MLGTSWKSENLLSSVDFSGVSLSVCRGAFALLTWFWKHASTEICNFTPVGVNMSFCFNAWKLKDGWCAHLRLLVFTNFKFWQKILILLDILIDVWHQIKYFAPCVKKPPLFDLESGGGKTMCNFYTPCVFRVRTSLNQNAIWQLEHLRPPTANYARQTSFIIRFYPYFSACYFSL